MSAADKRLGVGRRGADLHAMTRPQKGEALQMVLPDHLHVQPGFNPRGRINKNAFDPDRLAALADSIRVKGLLQPLLVRPRPGMPGQYLLIAGERRWRAVNLVNEADRQAGRPISLPTVPVLVRDVDDDTALELAIIENGQREQVDLIEESLIGIERMQHLTGMNTQQLRVYLDNVRKGREEDRFELDSWLKQMYGAGVSAWSQKRARVLDLRPEERDAVSAGLPLNVALVLLKAPDEQRANLLGRAVQEQLSVRELSALIDLSGQASVTDRPLGKLKEAMPRLKKLKGAKAERLNTLLASIMELLEE